MPLRRNISTSSTSCAVLDAVSVVNVPACLTEPYGVVSSHFLDTNATLIQTVVNIFMDPLAEIGSFGQLFL